MKKINSWNGKSIESEKNYMYMYTIVSLAFSASKEISFLSYEFLSFCGSFSSSTFHRFFFFLDNNRLGLIVRQS